MLCVSLANVWNGFWSSKCDGKVDIYQMLELVNLQNEMIGANEMNIVVRLWRCCAICSPFAYACIVYVCECVCVMLVVLLLLLRGCMVFKPVCVLTIQ